MGCSSSVAADMAGNQAGAADDLPEDDVRSWWFMGKV